MGGAPPARRLREEGIGNREWGMGKKCASNRRLSASRVRLPAYPPRLRQRTEPKPPLGAQGEVARSAGGDQNLRRLQIDNPSVSLRLTAPLTQGSLPAQASYLMRSAECAVRGAGYTPNRWATPCSSSLEPMTHSRPVTAAGPWRRSISPGTKSKWSHWPFSTGRMPLARRIMP